VFNFDVPQHPEDYIHRIGRTGRAGLQGLAYTVAVPEDRYAVSAIEKLTGKPIAIFKIDGLDEVSWAEDDGRKRKRGGGKGKGSAGDGGRGAPAKRVAAAPKSAIIDEPAAKPARAEPPRAEPKRAEPKRPDRPRQEPMRGERREPARAFTPRDDSPGVPTVGFGADVPAFMLITVRKPRPDPPAGRTTAAISDDMMDEENAA
jgi:superfamily II DNA/RNA helicase